MVANRWQAGLQALQAPAGTVLHRLTKISCEVHAVAVQTPIAQAFIKTLIDNLHWRVPRLRRNVKMLKRDQGLEPVERCRAAVAEIPCRL